MVLKRPVAGLLVVLLAAATTGLAGCEEVVYDSCHFLWDEDLSLWVGGSSRNAEHHVFSFKCEVEEERHTIDRYTFIMSLPGMTEMPFEPGPEELGGPHAGDVRFFRNATGAPLDRPSPHPSWRITFTDWDAGAALERGATPKITATWDGPDNDTMPDPRPGGWYNLTVFLRAVPGEQTSTHYCYGCGGPWVDGRFVDPHDGLSEDPPPPSVSTTHLNA
ncbi:MAG: hypothetical protein KY455_06315 [Euryarchaeota archaeon]|nr:hypothetical protein [Euryarchaeota archaeon]